MDNHYDIVVIGGGPNGLGIACYLAKCGLSVCVCEDRMELGGGAENAEPMPGFRIDPHATYMYGAAAPGFEQLELHKYGFRMNYIRHGGGMVTNDGKALKLSPYDLEGSINQLKKYSEKDAQLFDIFYNTLEKNAVDILRSIYWTPPPPEGMELDRDDLPWVKVMKKTLPMFDKSWCDLNTFNILDALFESEMLKVGFAMGSWYNGPHPDWPGTGIFGLTCNLLALMSSGSPLGGMHSFAHALIRCALDHNVRFLTNAKVEEIIIVDGEAKGVILADDAPVKQKQIYADKAVISGVHVKDTFGKLIPPRWLDLDFRQKVDDINLKGGSLFVLSLVTTELPQYKGDGEKHFADGYPTCVIQPVDSREILINQMNDVYSHNTHPTRPESMMITLSVHDIHDPTRCPPGYHVLSPIYLQMPPPEDHVDGLLAVNEAQDEIVDNMLATIRKVAPNMTEDKIVAKFVNTPYDSSIRNYGFVGGNWYGSRQGEEEWFEGRPLPELRRYRTPVDKLYLCNQTSYPGGLCLQAVPYNLMHILIEDLDLAPGEWWYQSPHYIPEGA
jgi:phytoene dehydrogenase-like protein